MSQLIQMRQRIKTIETIKKITHAMRLIAMSSHTRLKNTQSTFLIYKDAIGNIFNTVSACAPLWRHPLLGTGALASERPDLLIIVGSQKGLCGNFNTALLQLCKSELLLYKTTPVVITVGKRAHEFVTGRLGITPHLFFDRLSAATCFSIAKDITHHLMNDDNQYAHVKIISAIAKSFFSQVPRITLISPIKKQNNIGAKETIKQYTWDQEPAEIMPFLLKQYLAAFIQHHLLESVIAEAAARFISMDSSTRNAKNMLDTTQLQYNKLRQARITKELIELTTSTE